MLTEPSTSAPSAATVGELIAERAATLAHAPAILGAQGDAWDSATLLGEVNRVAAAIRSAGVGPSERVAIVGPNGPATAAAFLGAAAVAVSAPLNPAYGEEEFRFYLGDLQAKLLITGDDGANAATTAAAAMGVRVLDLAELPSGLAAGSTDALRPRDPDETALVLHTSGTTARPKQVPLSHRNLLASARHIAHSLALTADDLCLNVMPLFHIHGSCAGLLAPLWSGGSVVCPPGFLATEFFDWAEKLRPTWYTAVPTMHQSVLAQAERRPEAVYRGFRFLRSSSSALPPTVMRDLEQALGAPLVEAYGMTEAAHQIACNPLPPGERRPGHVGPAAGPEVAVMGPDGALLAPGEVGEVVIRGENVTAGYFNNPEANAEAFHNGWFRTGDEGVLSDDRYLRLTGRLKEIINRGGEKISPREIDETLLQHPAVRQATAFAVPDPRLGETVAAAVVLRSGAQASEGELREFVAERLAFFKVPARIVTLDEIPKGPTGKIQRIGLAERLGVTADAPAEAAAYAAPDGEVEELLCGVWSDVLKRQRIGVNDDFLELGGDSMLAAQLVARLRAELDLEIPIAALFNAPTIRGQAKIVEAELLAED